MHIAINALLLNTDASYRGAGVSNYSQHLLQGLGAWAASGGTAHCISAFLNDPHFVAEGITRQATTVRGQQPLLRIAWEQMVLPSRLRAIEADAVHGLVNVLPLRTRLPGVVTVHDLSFLRMPEKFRAVKRAYLTALCRASVRRAQRVIAVSQQTADDLIGLLGVSAKRLHVVYNGVSPIFAPGDAGQVAQFRAQQGLPDRFLFYLGTLEPRKNLERLVRAFATWQAETTGEAQAVKLVLAGAKGWFYQSIFQSVQQLGLERQVLFPGFIPAAQLPNWYRAAEALVYPSLFEGFGLPIVEAMASGTPVACSRVPSLLEVAGDAALTFAPDREAEMISVLDQLVRDRSVRDDLRKRGLAQAAKFSWQRCAQQVCEVYDLLR